LTSETPNSTGADIGADGADTGADASGVDTGADDPGIDSGAEGTGLDAGAAQASEAPADSWIPGPTPWTSSSVVIPAPKLADASTQGRGHRGLDHLAAAAMLAFVLVGGLLVFGFAQALVPAAQAQLGAACRPLTPTPKSGALPALELEDLEGNPVSLDEFRGKFLVVNFWATWCEPCTREWPDLDVLGSRMAARDDVAVIAISVDQEPAVIGPYLERMGLTETAVKILRAKDPEAHQQFGSVKIPDTYFVSPSGEFEAVFINVREWGKAKAVRCVEASADGFH
jgi:peroxiredoxin